MNSIPVSFISSCNHLKTPILLVNKSIHILKKNTN